MNIAAVSASTSVHTVIFYDGVCALCHRIVRFVIRHDHRQQFRFAALQGELAHQVLARHGANADDLDTMQLVEGLGTSQERLWSHSAAVVRTLELLGGRWRAFAAAWAMPRALRDRLYRWVVSSRYRTFGKYDSCPLPPPEIRARFLD